MSPGRRLSLLLGILVAAAASLATFNQLHDWDTFHHLALGRDILRRGGFAGEDPFLYPFAGVPIGPQPSWLGSVLVYLSQWALGDSGPLLLASAGAVAVFLLLLADSLAEEGSGPAAIAATLLPLGLALAVYRGRAVARPEMFANLLLAWTLFALRRHARGKRALLYSLPVALALWANLHQSVLAGVAVVSLFIVVNSVLLASGRIGRRFAEVGSARDLALPSAVLVAGIALAGLLSPMGFVPFLSPIRFALLWAGRGPGVAPGASLPAAGSSDDLMKALITELQPMQWGPLEPFTWLVVVAAASFAAAWLAARRLNVRELATCAAFVALAAGAVRFGAMASIVLAPVAARNLRAALSASGGRLAASLRWAAPLGATVALAIPWASTLARTSLRFGTGPSRQLPVRAVEYLRAAGGGGRLFNTFHFGGYLEWILDQQVYQDGRGGLHPDEVRGALLGPVSRETFEPLDDRYRFDALVIEYPEIEAETAAAMAATEPDEDWAADRRRWALVAFDDGGALYLRRDGALAARAARDEYRFARPAVPPGVGTRDLDGARADFERSVREAPGCARCRNALGYLYLREGRIDGAEGMFLGALDGSPLVRTQALFGLAQTSALRGDRSTAASRLREVIATVADPSGPRRQLALLLAEAGKPREALSEIRKNLHDGRAAPVDYDMAIGFAGQVGDADAVRELQNGRAAMMR